MGTGRSSSRRQQPRPLTERNGHVVSPPWLARGQHLELDLRERRHECSRAQTEAGCGGDTEPPPMWTGG